MKNRIIATLLFVFAILAVTPAVAQFADQQTWAGTGGGSANVQTVTLGNVTNYNQIVGVKIVYVPAATNTAAATIAVSGLSALNVRKTSQNSGGGLVALVGGELQVGQPVIVMYDGTNIDIMSGQYANTTSSTLANSALGFDAAINLAIYPSVSANALTINLCQAGSVLPTCNAPSATSPILIPFRNGTTIAYGNPIVASIQSAQSFTIASGSTMGCQSGIMCRIWVLEFYNAGSPALCAYNSLSGTNIGPINEGVLQTSQSGTSGGGNPQNYYCNVASVINSPIRILGYIEIQETTAGTWATGATFTQLFGPGILKPGNVVQRLFSTNNTSYNTTTAYAAATNFNQAITPTSAANLISAHAEANYQTTANDSSQAQLSRGTACSSLFGNVPILSGAAANIAMTPVSGSDVPNTTSSVTYALCAKSSVNGATVINGNSGNVSSMLLLELMVEREPANDDELRKAA